MSTIESLMADFRDMQDSVKHWRERFYEAEREIGRLNNLAKLSPRRCGECTAWTDFCECNNHGADMAANALFKIAIEGKQDGVFGGKKMQQAANAILSLHNRRWVAPSVLDFVCPSCGGVYWHTPNITDQDTIACSCTTRGKPLSDPDIAFTVKPCGWHGSRSLFKTKP